MAMIALATNQFVLTWLHAFPSDKSASKWKRIAYFMCALCVFAVNLLGLIGGTVFISKFITINLEESIYALFHVIASSNAVYQSILIVILRLKLSATFKKLAKIYQENEMEDSYPILKKTNETCEWMWSIYFKYIMSGTLIVLVMISVISVLFCHFVDGHFDVDRAYHPAKFILPWNQTTPLGYFLETSFATLMGEAYLITNGAIVILFISMCLHHRTFYKMFRNEARKLNFRDKTRNDWEHLRKLICLHVSFKDWFLETAAAFSPIITFVLISNMIFLSSIVFEFDLQMKHPNFALFNVIIAIPIGTSILFVYCFFGKMATYSYEKIADCLYDSNWRELSPKLQKYFIIMIENAQRPIHYHGFGIAVLNLETFTTMINAVYTYYMMFKTLANN